MRPASRYPRTDSALAAIIRQLALQRLPRASASSWVARLENALREQRQLASVDFKRLSAHSCLVECSKSQPCPGDWSCCNISLASAGQPGYPLN